MKENIENEISKVIELCKVRDYSLSTKKGYKTNLRSFFYHFQNIEPTQISEVQVNEYIQHLIKYKKYSRSSIYNSLSAINFYFRNIKNQLFQVKLSNLPPPNKNIPEYLSQDEIARLIDSISNKKHKAIIALLYSTGVKLKELLNFKIGDIKRQRNEIQIIGQDGTVSRRCYVSPKLMKIIDEYYRGLPTRTLTYLFEGIKPGNKYSLSSLQKFFQKYLNEQGIGAKVAPTILRHCYIKHMVELEVPLVYIMDELGINWHTSGRDYTRKIYGEKQMRFSPLDKTIFKREYDKARLLKLEGLVESLDSDEERTYILEALACLRVNAYRASVLQIWNAAIMKLRSICLTYPHKKIYEELLKIYPKSKQIKKIEDFEYVKDENLILLMHRMGHLSKSEKDVLVNNCLSLRNKCGHPVNVPVELLTVEAFIQEVIKIVYKKEGKSS